MLLAPFEVPKVGRAAVITDPQGAPLGLLRASFGDPAGHAGADDERLPLDRGAGTRPRRGREFYADLAGFEIVNQDEGDKVFRVLKSGGRSAPA